MEAGLIGTLDENEGIADTIGSNEVFYNDWSYSWKLLEQFEKIEPKELSEAARKYLYKENKTVGFLTKKKGGSL